MNLSERGRVAAGAKGSEEIGEGSNKPDSTKRKKKQMKKLMITAAAAMAGAVAFGGLCDTLEGGASPEKCRAYDFKASVKLVDGKTGKVSADSICDEDGTAYWRVSATRKIKGVFFDCDTCNLTNANAEGEAFLWGADQTQPGDFAHFYLSTSASKYKIVSRTADGVSTYKDSTGTDVTLAFDTYGGAYHGSAVYDFKILNFFGSANVKKAKKAEALIAIDFVEYDQFGECRPWSMLCAGFGAQSDGLVKNLSGNLAGAAMAATWCGIPTIVFEPCLLHPNFDSIDVDKRQNPWVITLTPATGDSCVPWSALLVDGTASWSTDAISGTWSIKYNKSESKAAYGSTVLKKVFGSGWEWIEKKAGPKGKYTDGWQGPLVVTKQQ